MVQSEQSIADEQRDASTTERVSTQLAKPTTQGDGSGDGGIEAQGVYAVSIHRRFKLIDSIRRCYFDCPFFSSLSN